MKRFSLKRFLALTCCAFMLAPMLASCGGSDESSQAPTDESGEEIFITVGEAEYALGGEINSESHQGGVYIYTRDNGKAAAFDPESSEKSFFDVAVIDETVVAIFEEYHNAVIPENGYILRFYGIDAEVKLGDKVETDLVKIDYIPEKCVKFGDVIIEIGYENLIRTAEETGWLYNENWYTGNTESNIYCTEIAVSEGKIVEINRSGDDIAGIDVPKGGFVLTVGENTALERKTAKLKVGDDAELISKADLYVYKKYGYAGTNRARNEDGIVIFNSEYGTTTPVGNNLTEIVVGENGTVEAVYSNCSGMYRIPTNGYIISATGFSATRMAREVTVGASVFSVGARGLCVVKTPITEYHRLSSELNALESEFKAQLDALSNIDYAKVESLINQIRADLSSLYLGYSSEKVENRSFDGDLLAEKLPVVQANAKQARNELVPYITVQDRTAWITLGEYDASMKINLHYKNQNDVDHTVQYAKNCGLNTLIIDNVACGFSVYESEVEGLVMLPQLNGFDLIKAFEKACGEQGIRLIVMVNSFSSGLDGVVYPENHYMSIFKDKYLKTNKGNHVGPDKVITLDPADGDVQAYNLAVIREIAEKYDVYGIQADYMRYPLPYYYQLHNYEDFGYNESTIKGFISKYGKNPAEMKINDPLWDEWCAWRRDIISEYQKKFYQTVKAVDENINVSFTCFADYRDRQIYTYQDVEKWAANGYADAIYPMIYGDNTEYQLKYANEILPITEHTTLILGVGTYVRASHQSMIEQLVMPYDLCAEGISIFTLRYISTCGYDETFRNAMRVAATPATAPDAELIPACAEMLNARILNLKYAQEALGEYDDAISSFFDASAKKALSLKDGITDFQAFSTELDAMKLSVEAADGLNEDVKKELVLAIDYIISLG